MFMMKRFLKVIISEIYVGIRLCMLFIGLSFHMTNIDSIFILFIIFFSVRFGASINKNE